MRQKEIIGEVVAYILTAVAGVLLFPVAAPYVMWTNAREYADRDAWVRIVLVVALLLLAGCGGLGGGTPTATTTSTPTETTTPTPTPTATPEPTPEPTPTPHPRTEKYETFMYQYATDLERMDNMPIRNWWVDGENETAYLTYEMRNPKNDVAVGAERENITLMYTSTVELYHKDNEEWDSVDETYIPETIYVKAVAPNGEHYETGRLEYEWAKQEMNGEIDLVKFVLNYYRSLEYGPANPQYTETPSRTATTETGTGAEMTTAPTGA